MMPRHPHTTPTSHTLPHPPPIPTYHTHLPHSPTTLAYHTHLKHLAAAASLLAELEEEEVARTGGAGDRRAAGKRKKRAPHPKASRGEARDTAECRPKKEADASPTDPPGQPARDTEALLATGKPSRAGDWSVSEPELGLGVLASVPGQGGGGPRSSRRALERRDPAATIVSPETTVPALDLSSCDEEACRCEVRDGKRGVEWGGGERGITKGVREVRLAHECGGAAVEEASGSAPGVRTSGKGDGGRGGRGRGGRGLRGELPSGAGGWQQTSGDGCGAMRERGKEAAMERARSRGGDAFNKKRAPATDAETGRQSQGFSPRAPNAQTPPLPQRPPPLPLSLTRAPPSLPTYPVQVLSTPR